ncbi:hypothetical protein Pcinc_033941 [Petrolisthes cinctipes]|uniref:Uncharacterized protein n=1 Tax=Petrolisthes cinctipes TaxID=88211 RepID=A0AAE1K0U8_PETCI|nr:hypothetical protein Pcinc_033941 [Petrolisthes cinctipes]
MGERRRGEEGEEQQRKRPVDWRDVTLGVFLYKQRSGVSKSVRGLQLPEEDRTSSYHLVYLLNVNPHQNV